MKANKKLWSAVYKAYDKVNDNWKGQSKGLDLDTDAGDGILYLHFIHVNKDETPGDDCSNGVATFRDNDKGLKLLLKGLTKLSKSKKYSDSIEDEDCEDTEEEDEEEDE